MSWLATTWIGALQLNNKGVQEWSGPVFDAYIAGAWILHWTEDTLYWVAKPRVSVEVINGRKRLHSATGPTLESDVENLYFWHGVMVPAFVITKPEWITVKHIQAEENAEVRRVMMERYGLSRFLLDSGAKKVDEDEFGELYQTEIPNDEPLVMVKVMNSTQEPDGSFKPYFLRVNPELRPLLKNGEMGGPQKVTALNAVASTFGMTGEEYVKSLIQQS